MRRLNYLCLFLLFFAPLKGQVKKMKHEVPLPMPAQLNWQRAELVNVFHPEQLDTDQWIRAAKAMGVKIAILTATHETGFALYQSDVNPYCMKALKWRDGKGDLVRDFRIPQDGSVFQKNRQTFYNKMCEGMTEEYYFLS